MRWPITAMVVVKRNTVNKEILINKKVLLTYKKGLLSFKKGLQRKKICSYRKKVCLHTQKTTRQITTANSHDN